MTVTAMPNQAGAPTPQLGAGDPQDPNQPFPLLPLRDDLQLLPSAPDRNGAPAWSIYDPLRNRYFRIGHAAFEMLSRWHKGRSDHLIASVRADTVLEPSPEDVRGLMVFLQSGGLLDRDDEEANEEFERIVASSKPPWYKWLVHNYLFIRIPLVRPDRFLDQTQWIADFFASPAVFKLIFAIGIVGIYLVTRQWDVFVTTFMGFVNLEGVILLGITMTVLKVLHELGHAYTANRYDCRVPTMGVAFLVMYPVLYTDVTDAWRLTSRKFRLRIGAAGVRVELAMALICTFLWNFVPDGPIRGAVFLVASASWVTTLLINLSPFMRFDGYYLMSDFLDVPNLQPRSFALTRWWVRERLFGFGLQPPEPIPLRLRRIMIAYGMATIIYRFFLFLGIALMVYYFFFKVLGIILYGVEMIWFIGAPIAKEIAEWVKHREHYRMNKNLLITVAILGGIIWLFVHPWNVGISAPAVWTAQRSIPVISAQPALTTEVLVKDGDTVKEGQLLYRLEAPQLESKIATLTERLKQTETALEQARADPERRGNVSALEQTRQQVMAEREQTRARMAWLTVRAPTDGIMRDTPLEVRAGVWISAHQSLGRVVSGNGLFYAYVSQSDLARIVKDKEVTFIPEDINRPSMTGTLTDIDRTAAEYLHGGYLSADVGGEIPARLDQNGNFVPLESVYRITATPNAMHLPQQTLRGTLKIEGTALSYFARMWHAVASVLLRESGF